MSVVDDAKQGRDESLGKLIYDKPEWSFNVLLSIGLVALCFSVSFLDEKIRWSMFPIKTPKLAFRLVVALVCGSALLFFVGFVRAVRTRGAVRFFERGVSIGPRRNPTIANYAELESFRVEILEPPDSLSARQFGKLAVSLLLGGASGVGYALATTKTTCSAKFHIAGYRPVALVGLSVSNAEEIAGHASRERNSEVLVRRVRT